MEMAPVDLIIKVGADMTVTIPQEFLDRIEVKNGEKVQIHWESDGLHLSFGKETELERQMEIGCRIMDRYPNTLRDLAE
jgi:hypothetical protein